MDARLAIVGTTILAHDGERAAVRRRCLAAIDKLQPAVVISGGAQGVDLLAVQAARERGYLEAAGTLLIHYPRMRLWKGPGGFEERNRQIVAGCTHLLRIFCEESRTYGSGWTADLAQSQGRVVVRWCACPVLLRGAAQDQDDGEPAGEG